MTGRGRTFVLAAEELDHHHWSRQRINDGERVIRVELAGRKAIKVVEK